MTDQSSIFNGDQPAPQEANPNPSTPEVKPENTADSLLQTIVGEDGSPKYKTVEDALQALPNSQNHISKIEAENAELREIALTLKQKLDEASKVEDVLGQLKADNQQAERPSVQGLDEQQVAGLVEQTLAQRDAAAKQKANQKLVADELSSRFQANAEAEYVKKAAELGMTVAQLNQMTATAPKAALALFGQSTKAPTPTSGSLNTMSMQDAPKSKGPNPLVSGRTSDAMAQIERIKQEMGLA
jgi:hypothetical protein